MGYEIKFIEIGLDLDHIHFLIQGIPNMSITQIIKIIKSITAREVFKKHQEIKKQLYGGIIYGLVVITLILLVNMLIEK